jgi:hypothetical protein
MSPLTIIALTSLAVLFLLLLVLIGGALIFVFLRAHKLLSQFQDDLAKLIVEMREQNSNYQREMLAAIAKINGDELNKAVSTFVSKMDVMAKFVNRAENAALAMGEMCKLIVSDSAVSSGSRTSYGPEEYAQSEPGEGKSQTQSVVAKLDELELGDM